MSLNQTKNPSVLPQAPSVHKVYLFVSLAKNKPNAHISSVDPNGLAVFTHRAHPGGWPDLVAESGLVAGPQADQRALDLAQLILWPTLFFLGHRIGPLARAAQWASSTTPGHKVGTACSAAQLVDLPEQSALCDPGFV